MMIIRPATIEDLDWLIIELKQFSEFFGSKYSLFEEDYWWDGLRMMISDHLVLIAEDVSQDKERMGLIAGFITPHPFNPKIKMLAETFWWVSEAHRRTRAGLMLLNEFVEYGKKHCQWITMSLETKSPVREDCLLRRGFHQHERNYLLEI